jgi:S-adenosylhomocysteine hydrolase
MSKYLQDPEYLFSILTVLVKKNGGMITLTEKEMKDVSTGDLIGMYFEPKTGNIVLKEVDPQDMLQATTIIRDKKETDKVYDN